MEETQEMLADQEMDGGHLLDHHGVLVVEGLVLAAKPRNGKLLPVSNLGIDAESIGSRRGREDRIRVHSAWCHLVLQRRGGDLGAAHHAQARTDVQIVRGRRLCPSRRVERPASNAGNREMGREGDVYGKETCWIHQSG